MIVEVKQLLLKIRMGDRLLNYIHTGHASPWGRRDISDIALKYLLPIWLRNADVTGGKPIAIWSQFRGRGDRGISDISPRRDTADVTGGKSIAVWSQSISVVSVDNPFVSFYGWLGAFILSIWY
jgi:hypothetical protein